MIFIFYFTFSYFSKNLFAFKLLIILKTYLFVFYVYDFGFYAYLCTEGIACCSHMSEGVSDTLNLSYIMLQAIAWLLGT